MTPGYPPQKVSFLLLLHRTNRAQGKDVFHCFKVSISITLGVKCRLHIKSPPLFPLLLCTSDETKLSTVGGD